MGLVLISHSGTLVTACARWSCRSPVDEVAVATAGGTEDGRLGTSAPLIAEASARRWTPARRGCSSVRPGQRRAQPGTGARRPRTRGSAADPRQRSAVGRRSDPRRGPGQRRERRWPRSRLPPPPRPRCPSSREHYAGSSPARARSGRPARPSRCPLRAGRVAVRESDRAPLRRARGRCQKPHRAARTDGPPVVRDRHRRRGPGCGGGHRRTRSPSWPRTSGAPRTWAP